MKASPAAYELVKRFEGCRLTPYFCPAGVLTVGYGSTVEVVPGERISQAEAEDRLQDDIEAAEKSINAAVTVPLTQNQYDALVSWTFNLGGKRLQESTMLKRINEGNFAEASLELRKWDKGGGRVLPGLVQRRLAESRLFDSKETA